MTGIRESATLESRGSKWLIKVIESGQGSSAFYPADVLERDGARTFPKGTQMFFDHATEDEVTSRPEGSVRSLIGKFTTDAWYEDGALFAEAQFYPTYATLINEFAEDVGISVRATGRVEEAEGTNTLVAFGQGISVDVVTKAGAGGKFLELLEAAEAAAPKDDEVALKETATVVHKTDDTKEIKMDEAERAALVAEISDAVIGKIAEHQTKVAEAKAAEDAAKEAEAAKVSPLDIAEALSESGLSKTGQRRALAAHEAGVDLKEAIKAEVDYQKEIAEAAGKAPVGGGNVQTVTETNRSELVAGIFN